MSLASKVRKRFLVLHRHLRSAAWTAMISEQRTCEISTYGTTASCNYAGSTRRNSWITSANPSHSSSFSSSVRTSTQRRLVPVQLYLQLQFIPVLFNLLHSGRSSKTLSESRSSAKCHSKWTISWKKTSMLKRT